MEKQNPDLPLQPQKGFRLRAKLSILLDLGVRAFHGDWRARIHRLFVPQPAITEKKTGPARDRKRRSVKCRPCETLERWITDWSWIEMNLCIPKWSIRHRPERRVFRCGLPMLKLPVWGDATTTYYNPNGIPQSTGITSMSCFPVRTSPGLSRELTRKWSSWPDGIQVHNAHTHRGHRVNNHKSYARTQRVRKSDQLPKKLQHRG